MTSSRPPRRRYELRRPDLNEAIDTLLARTEEAYGAGENRELIREILVSALRLMRDDAARGDVKLVNNALKELRHAFQVFAPYKHVRKVAAWGSARTGPDHPDWEQARDFARRMTEAGWMTITGAGDGVMGAAQLGAGRESSFGVNIRLPFEQSANPVIAGDRKLMNFRYFFTRKVMFVKEAHALALFPGGFGTHDEMFEVLTLIQTGKSELLPVVFVDSPGESFWEDWKHYIDNHLRRRGLIGEADDALFRLTDNVDEAVSEILNFYSNYHSSRYVGDRLVLRVRVVPGPEELEELSSDFRDILAGGGITTGAPLPEEGGEASALPRLFLDFNRRHMGRLRMLIDRLNSLVTEEASPPREASPRLIPAQPLSAEDEKAEQHEEE